MNLGEICALMCAVLWSFAVIAFRKAGDSVPPRELNLFKNTLGLALFALTVLVLQQTLWMPTTPRQLLILLFSGILGIGVADALVLACLNSIGATRWAIVECSYSPTVIVLSVAFLDEQFGPIQILGTGLILLAVLLVSVGESADEVPAADLRRGVLIGVGAIVTMVVGILLVKPLYDEMDLFWLSELRLVGGVLGSLLTVMLGRGLGSAVRSWKGAQNKGWQVTACVLSVYVAMFFWLMGFKHADASMAAVLNQTGTIFTVLLAVWILREPSGWRTWTGTGLAILGVLLTQWPSIAGS